MKTVRFSLALLAGAILAACSSGSTSGGGADATPPPEGDAGPGGTCKAYVACDLLTASDVGAAMGGAYGQGSEHDGANPPTSRPVVQEACNYFPPTGASVSLAIACDASQANDATSFRASLVRSGLDVTDVAGVGDAAFWAVPVPDSSTSSYPDQLHVFVGEHTYLWISISHEPASGPDPRAAATQMAKAALARL